MFETAGGSGEPSWLAGLVACLDGLDQDVSDAVRVDRLRDLEELKAAASAAQAREAVALAVSQRAAQLAQGVAVERADRGIAAQVGLALRVSPWQAARWLGWCRVLTGELPHTFAALRTGRLNERRAMIVARETVWLSRQDRLAVDEQLAPQLDRLGDRRLEAEVRTLGYRLDPAGFVERSRAAEKDRRVSLRPAPDAMVRLTGLLPVAQGVACYAALARAADTATADTRGRGQMMADTLVERLTGQAAAGAVPVEVHLLMTDTALLAAGQPGGDEPALLDGEPIPAPIARALVLDAPEQVPVWLRRLYRSGNQLIAMDSTRRTLNPIQRRFIRLRDRSCRTPWCDAPIRHVDHIQPYAAGGPTSIHNSQGYCVGCNHAKQAPGWTHTVISPSPPRPGPHDVEITTPTRHHYRSRAPDIPRVA